MSNPDFPQAQAPPAKTPARVWVGLAIAVVLDAPVQLMWKALMLKYHRQPEHSCETVGQLIQNLTHQARWFSHQTRTWGLLALFACQFFDWIWVLGNADLSFAQPFTALSYVVVSSCAVIFFHEHLGPMRVLGIAAILIGVVLVGSSDHRTVDLAMQEVEPLEIAGQKIAWPHSDHPEIEQHAIKPREMT